jgi:hypothetical protein
MKFSKSISRVGDEYTVIGETVCNEHNNVSEKFERPLYFTPQVVSSFIFNRFYLILIAQLGL